MRYTGVNHVAFATMGKHFLLLALLGVLAYSNTLNSPFVFDDFPGIVENELIRDLSAFSKPGELFGTYEGRRYLGFLSLALNYRIHGTWIVGYHIFNLLIHIVTASMVYLLVLQMLSYANATGADGVREGHDPAIALLAGSIFICHPVETQAVTYIVQRLSSLAAMMFLGSLIAYSSAMRAGTGRKKRTALFVLSLAFAVCATLTKEHTIVLPLVVLLFDLIFIKSPLRRLALSVLPYFIVSAIIPVQLLYNAPAGALSLDSLMSATRLQTDMPRGEYFLTQTRVLVTYLRLIFVPVGQRIVYDYHAYPFMASTTVALSALLHIALISGAVFILRSSDRMRAACVSFGVLFFYVANLVESSVFPISDVIFEHRVYLPSVGIIIAVSVVLGSLYRSTETQKVFVVSAVVIVAVLGLATYNRNRVWKTEASLWSDAVGKSPSHQMARYALADAYYYERRFEEAIFHYKESIRLKPAHVYSYNNMGLSYHALGEYGSAEDAFMRALNVEPASTVVLVNLGITLDALGRDAEAIEIYKKAIGLAPGLGEAHYNLGVTYFKTERFDEALMSFRTALGIDQGNHDAAIYIRRIEEMGAN